jgi:hypothetical protein
MNISFAIAMLALVHGLTPGQDPDKVKEAKTYFDAGKQAYEAGRYAVAASAFEEAQRLSPRPQILFSLAQAVRQQYFVDRDPVRLKHAIDLFKQYMQEVPQGGRRDHASQHLAELEPLLRRIEDDQKKSGRSFESAPKLEAKTQLMVTSRTPGALASVDGEEGSEVPLIRDVKAGKHKVKVEAPGFIAEEAEAVAVEGRLIVADLGLKEKPAMIALSAPEGSDVTLDGRLVGTAPLPAALELPSGRHYVVVTERGAYPFARDLTLDRGERLTVEAKLQTTTQRTVAYWSLGVAGALAAAGAVTGIVALAAENRAKSINDRLISRQGLMGDDITSYHSAVDQRDRFAPVSFVLLGASAAVGVAGALLFFVDSPRVEPF